MAARLPLEGIRVVDLTVVWAGPTVTMILGDLGAQVIRVESRYHPPGSTRGILPPPPKEAVPRTGNIARAYVNLDPGQRPWNRHAMFNWHGRNKLSMTLEIDRPRGLEVFRRLVEISDILVENNAAGLIERLGIDYPVVSSWNPRLIMLRMPPFGLSGPYKYFQGFGSTVEAVAGFVWIRHYPDSDPTSATPTFHMDAASGAAGAFAVLAALHYRNRTGRGMLIDLAQAENMIQHIGEIILDYTMNGRVQGSYGNRHPTAAPHGVYRCQGDDRWVAISVFTDAEFAALCQVMGRPELTADPRFSTLQARRANQDELDRIIEAWTLTRTPRQVFEALQAAGVPAGPVMDERDAYEDPHARARGWFKVMTHPECGTHEYPGHLWRQSEVPLRFETPAPCLGEHNEYVYKELLGYSDAEYEELARLGHIGTDYVFQQPTGIR